jgi:hypothetical protein
MRRALNLLNLLNPLTPGRREAANAIEGPTEATASSSTARATPPGELRSRPATAEEAHAILRRTAILPDTSKRVGLSPELTGHVIQLRLEAHRKETMGKALSAIRNLSDIVSRLSGIANMPDTIGIIDLVKNEMIAMQLDLDLDQNEFDLIEIAAAKVVQNNPEASEESSVAPKSHIDIILCFSKAARITTKNERP